jgi:hypothetical protein
MLTISIAKFFVDIVGKEAVQDEAPAGRVLNSPQSKHKPKTWKARLFSLLPSGVQHRITLRRDLALRQAALTRLAELSPHLLADIGIVQTPLATFDGKNTFDQNPALTELQKQDKPATQLAPNAMIQRA